MTADEAIEKAEAELRTGVYAGVNYLCVDRSSGGVVYGGNEISVDVLHPGLHILTANRMDDPEDQRQEYVRRLLTLHRLDSSVAFLAAASGAFSRTPDATGKRGVVISEIGYGTVSSMLVSLSDRSAKSIMQFADGSPDEAIYDDVSALLRQVLSTDRASQKKAKAKKGADSAAKDVGNSSK